MKTNIKIKHDGNNCKFKELQEVCFKNGVYWRVLDSVYRDTTDVKYGIFIDDRITSTSSERYFEDVTDYEEVDIDLFIKTNGTCEEKPIIGIEVGDEYLNSAGKKCTISEILYGNYLKYLHQDGHIYQTTRSNIKKNWTKLTKSQSNHKEEQMPLIDDYAIELYGTSLEDRLKLRDTLLLRKEHVYSSSIAFNASEFEEEEECFCNLDNTQWIVECIDDCKDKIKISLQDFLNKFALHKDQIEQTKTTKKGSTIMEKVKQTAKKTVSQNKEAAIIASKMEAGRILNKQVLKQAAKHVPFWAKGYLDSPLAPIIIANAAAMLGNHTGNTKVQKLSELMLLAAADTTVQSFNLDKIIDDALAGIKLPAGILDADDN